MVQAVMLNPAAYRFLAQQPSGRAADGRLPLAASRVASGFTPAAGFLSLLSRIAGILGLTAAVIAGLWPAVSAPYPWSSAQSASRESRTACGSG
jgi:hypothetical protein